MLSIHILPLAEHAQKFVFTYAEHAHGIIFENDLKIPNENANFTINNQNLEKPSRNPPIKTKVKILKKKNFLIAHQKIWFRVCLVTAKMFDHRNSGKNLRKRIEIFFEIERAYKFLL
jgi:hypothetical protein